MSWQASSWALELTLGDARRKMVLVAIASYADPKGRCAFASLATLAQNCDLKVNALRRRIRELEQIGVVHRFVRRIVAGGKIVSYSADGPCKDEKGAGVGSNGRRTSDEFWVNMALTKDEVEAAARLLFPGCFKISSPADEDANENETETVIGTEAFEATTPSPPQCGEANDLPSPHESVSDPPHGGGGILQTNPKTFPPKGVFQAEPSKARQKENDESFERFRTAYPISIEHEPKTRAIWEKLSAQDREVRIRAASRYASELKRFAKRTPVSAHRWLGSGQWQGYARDASIDRVECPERGSPADRALVTLGKVARYTPFRMSDGRLNYIRPITPRLLGLADTPPQSNWRCYPRGSREFAAWRAFIAEVFAGMALPALMELSAPWPFPPRVDGTVFIDSHSTDPPDNRPVMTDADERFLDENGL